MQKLADPYLRLPTGHSFDYAFLLNALNSYSKPRDKITRMIERGEIVRIRKGLYIRAWEYGGNAEPDQAANALYGPSYLSLEYMLSRYGIIPERVWAITSATSKRSKIFTTPVGNFKYEHIPANAYPAGIKMDKKGGVPMLVASPEKALCDKLALASNIRTIDEIVEYLDKNLRVDFSELEKFSIDELNEIDRAYSMSRIHLFVHWFEKGHRSV